jgi:hypothetical protein
VGTVAVGLVIALFAAAKVGGTCLGGNKGDWGHAGSVMGTIAKGLVGTASAGAPVVAFPFLQLNGKRCFLNNNSFVSHVALSWLFNEFFPGQTDFIAKFCPSTSNKFRI